MPTASPKHGLKYIYLVQKDIFSPANSSKRTSFWSKYQFLDTDGGFVFGSTTVDTAYDGYYLYPGSGGNISGTVLVYGYGE